MMSCTGELTKCEIVEAQLATIQSLLHAGALAP